MDSILFLLAAFLGGIAGGWLGGLAVAGRRQADDGHWPAAPVAPAGAARDIGAPLDKDLLKRWWYGEEAEGDGLV